MQVDPHFLIRVETDVPNIVRTVSADMRETIKYPTYITDKFVSTLDSIQWSI